MVGPLLLTEVGLNLGEVHDGTVSTTTAVQEQQHQITIRLEIADVDTNPNLPWRVSLGEKPMASWKVN